MENEEPSNYMKVQDLINDFRGLLATPSSAAIKLGVGDLSHDEFFNFCLVAKLHAEIIPSIKGLIGVLRRAWTFIAPFEVREAKNGIFLLSFKSKEDLQAVWDASPWCYNGTLIILERFRRCTPVECYNFNSAPLWVQFHDLPPDMMTPSIATKLASRVGEVIPIAANRMMRASFVRVRILADLRLPLEKSLIIRLDNEKDLEIRLAYERLPRFCLFCGRLGHDIEHCKTRNSMLDKIPPGIPQTDRTSLEEFLQPRYPLSLSATPWKSSLADARATPSSPKMTRGNSGIPHHGKSASLEGLTNSSTKIGDHPKSIDYA
uniref:CCHC-type domain-containing protein n=1 Tax=Ananas comosus var. bracteatus TaxID=296719 RepID=A0A6V7NHR2_ANACO|nr:unnamed protein product [Ananas comosus var. bracteatus]